jgi:hypothetical protein
MQNSQYTVDKLTLTRPLDKIRDNLVIDRLLRPLYPLNVLATNFQALH